MFFIIFTLVGCSNTQDTETPISKNSFIAHLPFEVGTDTIEDAATAMSFLSGEASQKLGLPAYLMTNNDILLTNDLDGKSNLIEELTYSANTNQRILKYRYLCKNDFDKFDNKYVKKQIQTVFDIDLNEYDFDGTIIGLKEKLASLEMDTVFPIRVDTGNDISIVIGIAKTNEGNFISVVGTYEVVQIIE